MGNWAQLYADLTAQLQAGQALGFWDNAFVGFYQSFVAAGRWRLYLNGLLTTLEATILALLLGVVLGVVVAVIRTAHDQQRAGHKNVILGVFNAICKIYTTIIRGTPMMVQLLIMSLVIFASSRNYTMIGILALGINSGAYVSEIVRSGLMSVDPGQMEAGRSLGMNYFTTMRFIVIPQAIKNILPALGNEFITLLKDTSLITKFCCYIVNCLYNLRILACCLLICHTDILKKLWIDLYRLCQSGKAHFLLQNYFHDHK